MLQTEGVEKIQTHILSSFFFENRAVYETNWKIQEPERPQMIIWRMRIAWGYLWLPTHTQNIIAFPLFFIFCWPCLSLQNLANDQLDALFHVFISFISLHVSSITMLIIRRSNCVNISYGM